MVNEHQSSGTGKKESSSPVSPSESSDGHREEESHGDDEREIPLVLPDDDLVLGQIGDVGDSRLSSRLEDHPSNVRPEQSLVRGVGVEIGIGVSVMRSMSSRPPFNRSFDGTGSSEGEEVLEGERRGVRAVGPKPVVAGGDSYRADSKSARVPRVAGTSRLTETSVEVAVGGDRSAREGGRKWWGQGQFSIGRRE